MSTYLLSSKSTGDYVLDFFTGFFGTPALLIGLFALLGCIIQRKSFAQTITSVFKTIIGFLIIGGGATIISGSIGKFGNAFVLLFNREGWLANNDVMPGLFISNGLNDIATSGSLILIFALILNVIIARLSGFKYIYLTGHSAWYFSTMVASVMYIAGLDHTSDMWLVIVAGSMFVSIWMIISPAMLNKYTMVITKGANLSIAHTGSITYFMSGLIGEAIYKAQHGKVKYTEDIRFPKGLAFLRNTNVSIALTMFVLYCVVYFTCWGTRGFDAMVSAGVVSQSDSVIVQGIIQAFTFAAGVEVLLIGVRMFIAELIPAFKGVAEKVVKGSKPGVDCPTVFPFAPNAVIIGFLASLAGGLITFAVNIAVSSSVGTASIWAPIIIISIVPHFFTGATSGVFGNAKGGILGCVIGAFLNGILITLVPYFFIVSGFTESFGNGSAITWGDFDFIIGLIPAYLVKYATGYGFLGIIAAVWLAFPIVFAIMHAVRMKKNPQYNEWYTKTKALEKEKSTKTKERRVQFTNDMKDLKVQMKAKSTVDEKNEVEKSMIATTNLFNRETSAIEKEYNTQILSYKEFIKPETSDANAEVKG